MAQVASRSRLNNVIFYVLLTAGAVIMSLPLVYLISTAFKPINEIISYPPPLFPRKPTLRSFSDLVMLMGFTQTIYIRYIFNSLVVTGGVVVLTIVVATMAAYPLAKHRFPGKNLLFFIVILGLTFSPHVTLIPRYLIIYKINWIDKFWALIIPALANSYGVFLLKQFMEAIPNELIEASKIDGASEYSILRRVIVPLLKPAWCTLTIFVFTWSWNDYVSPLLYMKKDSMMTLQIALSRLSIVGTFERMGAISAAALLTTLPVIIVFIIFQRYVVATMAFSGLKT